MSVSNAMEETQGVACLFPMQWKRRESISNVWKRPGVWDVYFQCSGRGVRYGMSISNVVEEAWGMGCLFPMQWKRPEVWDVCFQCSGRGLRYGMSVFNAVEEA